MVCLLLRNLFPFAIASPQRRLRVGRIVLIIYIAISWALATGISIFQALEYNDDALFRDSIVVQNISTLIVATLCSVFSIAVSVRLFKLHKLIKASIRKVCSQDCCLHDFLRRDPMRTLFIRKLVITPRLSIYTPPNTAFLPLGQVEQETGTVRTAELNAISRVSDHVVRISIFVCLVTAALTASFIAIVTSTLVKKEDVDVWPMILIHYLPQDIPVVVMYAVLVFEYWHTRHVTNRLYASLLSIACCSGCHGGAARYEIEMAGTLGLKHLTRLS